MESTDKKWTDWVGELFSPAFGFTVDEILDGKDELPVHESKIKRVAAFDPEAIRNVYEKVRVMTAVDEEMRAQKEDKRDTPPRKDIPKVEKKEDKVDLNDSCIWNSEEISVLREVFKTVKKQNLDLQVMCRELKKRNKELESGLSDKTKSSETQNVEYIEAKKANGRLKIHCQSLQSELDLAQAKTSAMEEVLKEMTEEKSELMKEVLDLRVKSDADRMQIGQLQMKLDTLSQEALCEKIVAEENIKGQCEKQMFDLQQKVKELTDELEKEQDLHVGTKRGLDHLRNHFASLPMANIYPPNAVSTDQVKKINYL